jgi:DNA-binding response OmpR family regulator
MKILLVEDEPKVAAFLEKGLTEQQHKVEVAADGVTGLRRALAESSSTWPQWIRGLSAGACTEYGRAYSDANGTRRDR